MDLPLRDSTMNLRLVLLVVAAFGAVALTPALDTIAPGLSPTGEAAAARCIIGSNDCIIEIVCIRECW